MVFRRPNFTDYCLELNIIMKAPTNIFWMHGMPRQSERKSICMNFTFLENGDQPQEKKQGCFVRNKQEIEKGPDSVESFGDIHDNMFPLRDYVLPLYETSCGYTSKDIKSMTRCTILQGRSDTYTMVV